MTKEFKCSTCNKIFASKYNCKYHEDKKVCKSNDSKILCTVCNKYFSCQSTLKRHVKNICSKSKDTNTEKDTDTEKDSDTESVNPTLITTLPTKITSIRDVKSTFQNCSANEDNDFITLMEKFKKLENENNILQQENNKLKRKIQIDDSEINNSDKHQTINNNVINNNVTKNVANNVTNNNVTNNNVKVNNKIIIVGFGKEDMNKIGLDDLLHVMQRGFYSPLDLIEKTHFNHNLPEYHNVYISNIKNKYVNINDGTRWILADKKEIVNKLYEEKKCFIEYLITTKLYDNLRPFQQKILQDLIKTDNTDPKVEKIKDKIILLMYNRNHMPKKIIFQI